MHGPCKHFNPKAPCIPEDQSQINTVLFYIKSILEQYHRDLSKFDIPLLNLFEQNQETLPKLMQEE
ncbi:36327_t:CDS:2 [Gigaspora margarita]|uniref:36327_t:CDS:1 n=1 Tax=Gigaspora margarita TaxID=4874 RepID=A0ABM8VVN3_GIGMA|nr:36327_t:CDS:2 [Gigaspora margarita]